MDERAWLLERFEAHRGHLRAVAHRMLGSAAEADEALRATRLRLAQADATNVDDLRAWLTTVVGRVSLEMIRSRERPADAPDQLVVRPRVVTSGEMADAFELDAMLGESVSVAFLAALNGLAPAERIAFVLHQVFGVPFDEIATMVSCSPAVARRLVGRARRRIRAARAGRHTSAAGRVYPA